MKISLKEKKIKNNKVSLYLEFYKGSSTDTVGKRNHIREFEYLQIYLHENPKNIVERKENKENLELAQNILAIRKSEHVQGKFGIKSSTKSKKQFLEYFEEKANEKENSVKNYGVWTSALHHLKICVSPNLIFDEIDEDFVKKVRYYFDVKARTKSNLPLSTNSKYSYFNKVKACLRSAFDDGFVSVNYATKVKAFEQAESQRVYLIF